MRCHTCDAVGDPEGVSLFAQERANPCRGRVDARRRDKETHAPEEVSPSGRQHRASARSGSLRDERRGLFVARGSSRAPNLARDLVACEVHARGRKVIHSFARAHAGARQGKTRAHGVPCRARRHTRRREEETRARTELSPFRETKTAVGVLGVRRHGKRRAIRPRGVWCGVGALLKAPERGFSATLRGVCLRGRVLPRGKTKRRANPRKCLSPLWGLLIGAQIGSPLKGRPNLAPARSSLSRTRACGRAR